MRDLRAAGVPVEYDGYCIASRGTFPIHLWISTRPHYCDRGRWLVHAESSNPALLTIDWADGFPRYYFHTECLVKEVQSWLATRLAQLPPTETPA